MPKILDFWVGVVTVLTGLFILAWTSMLKKLLAKRRQSGEHTEEQVYDDLKNLELVVISSLVVGAGLICKYIFKLY